MDETMIRFQGASHWITIIRGKPISEGYKLYTDASCGYLQGFRIYRGKGGYDVAQSVLHHTVVELVRPWCGANRTLYFDNLYTSPALCRELLEWRTRSCGTCRSNRAGLPKQLGEAKNELAKDELESWQRGQLGCLVWHDSRPVVFLSTHIQVDQLTAIAATSWKLSYTSQHNSRWTASWEHALHRPAWRVACAQSDGALEGQNCLCGVCNLRVSKAQPERSTNPARALQNCDSVQT